MAQQADIEYSHRGLMVDPRASPAKGRHWTAPSRSLDQTFAKIALSWCVVTYIEGAIYQSLTLVSLLLINTHVKPFIYEARESSLVPEGFLIAQLLQKL